MSDTGARANTNGFSVGKEDAYTYDIDNATVFNGNLPISSGLARHTDYDIQLAIGNGSQKNVILQFILLDTNKSISIHAFDPNSGRRAKIVLSIFCLSIDRMTTHGTIEQKTNARRIKDMVDKSGSYISESSISSIINELRKRRNDNAEQ